MIVAQRFNEKDTLIARGADRAMRPQQPKNVATTPLFYRMAMQIRFGSDAFANDVARMVIVSYLLLYLFEKGFPCR